MGHWHMYCCYGDTGECHARRQPKANIARLVVGRWAVKQGACLLVCVRVHMCVSVCAHGCVCFVCVCACVCVTCPVTVHPVSSPLAIVACVFMSVLK